jgi:branched-chain amino acid transport system permease protein
VAGAIALSAINSWLLPDVLYSLPSRIGLDFDFSAIASGVYGAIIVVVMLLAPNGLLPARWAAGGQRFGDRPRAWR